MATIYPNPAFPADAVLEALGGTTDQDTGLVYLPVGTAPTSVPTLTIQFRRIEHRLRQLLTIYNEGRVVDEGSLDFGVYPMQFRIAGADKTFNGATNQAAADDSTIFVWLDSTPTLQTGGAFPGDLTTFAPLAKIVTASGVMTVTDERRRSLFAVNQLAGAYANATLSNLAAVAINESLISDTDDADDLGSAAKAWQSVYLRTSMILTQASFNYTLTWADPAAARALSIPDPLADATFALITAAGKLANTLSDFTNATHDHSDAAGGGNLDQGSHGTGKYVPVVIPIHIPGTLVVDPTGAPMRVYTPIALTFRDATGRVKTAPTDADLIMDVRVDGVSLFSSQAEMVLIADGTLEDTSATKDVAVAAGSYFDIEVEQVGSTIAGADATVTLNCLTALASV